MEPRKPRGYNYDFKKHQCLIILIHIISVWLAVQAAPSTTHLVTAGTGSIHEEQNVTANDNDFEDRNGNEEPEDTLPLRGRITNSIRMSNHERELSKYDTLWRQHITDSSRVHSKINVLGDVLKQHVAKLRRVENGQVELVFIVDSSSSVGLKNFFNELKFVKKLLADFTVAREATRVAVITFSSSHRVVANVDQLSVPNSDMHKCSLLKEELPSITYVGGGTYTKGALELAENVLLHARPDSTKAVFLVTDGYSNGGNPLPHARALKNNGVEIFTFGIRDGNVQELFNMSSVPHNEHCYIVDNFTEFEALARRALHEDLQIGDFIVENYDRCSSLCPAEEQCCDVTATCRCGTHTGQYECVCPPGSYGNGLRAGCQPCPSGTYKTEALPGGVSTCHSCPDRNHSTPLGSTSMDECRCNTGFKTIPPENRCEEIRCPPLRPPSNGIFVSGECSNTVNRACAMRCNPGHELTGSTIRLCNETGQWTGQETICPVKTCNPLPRPPNSTVECNPPDSTRVDTLCSVLCDAGYTLLGSSSRRCLPIAQWNGLPNDCRAISCPPLPNLRYGTYIFGACTEQKQPFGTVCRARCSSGFRLQGATTRQCLASGKWEETPETLCIDITPPTIVCPDDIIVEAAPNDNARNVNWDMPHELEDNSGEEPALTVIPAIKSPWLIRIGSVTLKYIATDKAGNSAHCKFRITVVDNQHPVIDHCRSPDVFLTSEPETEVTWEVPQFSDNSGNPVMVFHSHEPGIRAPLGITDVEYIAEDDSGNTQSCHIYINVQPSPCIVPDAPAGGSTSCVSSDSGVDCVLTCNPGHGFAIATSAVYHCDNNGVWYPTQQLPWIDCSEQNAASNGEKVLQFALEAEQCNQEVIMQVQTTLTETLRSKVMQYCTNSVKCRLGSLSAKCSNRGVSVVLDGAERLDVGTQPLKQALNARTDVSPTDVTYRYNEFKQYSVNVVVELNVTGYVTPGRGDALSKPEYFQKQLLNTLSSIPNAILEDITSGDLDVGIDAQPDGTPGNMLSMNSLPSELVCSPGAVLVNGTQCVQCARGMFYEYITKQCERCPTGTYQDYTGQFECNGCPHGTSTVTSSSKALSDCRDLCTLGTYSASGLEQCETCPRGTYQPLRGMTKCVSCPMDTSTYKTGSTTDMDCAVRCGPGHVSRSGFVPCLPCPSGFFQPAGGMTSCLQCPHDVTTEDKGATSITQCQGLEDSNYKLTDQTGLPYLVFNDCFSAPCSHDGECLSVPSGYLCTCKPGFTGANCEIDINECEDDVCLNNATCIDYVNDFSCVCPPGFQGPTCSINLDECISEPCLHNSTCHDGPASYQCVCSKGYQGTHCDVEIDECASSPCHHSGQCIDFIGGYECVCFNGFHGDQCDEEIDECLSQPCFNNATCFDYPGFFSCTCPVGFEGVQCSVNINECASLPCHAGGQCVDDVNEFSCHCLPGFMGKMCEIELPWNFSLVFEHIGTTDYVLLEKVLPVMREISVAFWMQTTDSSNYGCPFSYATSATMANAFTLMDYTGFALYVNGQSMVTDVSTNDGLWHHIVATWSNLEGEWHIYKDGEEEAAGEGLAVGTLIQGDGVFVIGQEQDAPGGGFNLVESFLGEITLLNIWDRILNKNDVRALHRSCDKQTDVVKAWPEFLNGITGRVLKVDNHFCQGCFSPLHPKNGNFSGDHVNETLSVVTYSCNMGFEFMKGPREAVCQISGEWMPSSVPHCQRVLCGHPGMIENGRVVVDTYMYGDMVHYYCDANFTLFGARTQQCLASRQWSAHQPFCRKTSCGIREVLNARVVNEIPYKETVFPGTSVQYACLPGYQLTGRFNVTCKPNGRWTSHPKCNPIRCPRPRVISNGYVQAAESLTVGNSITFHCVAGYRLIGENQRPCLVTGAWGGAVPSCEPLVCGEPPDVKNASRNGFGFSFGQSVSYMCDVGSVQQGPIAVTCTETGVWSPPPICTPRPCPPLPTVHHGSVIGEQFYFGQSVQVQCDYGYILNGVAELECTAYGRWSAPPAQCQRISCGRPDPVEHASYSANQFNLGDEVRYFCQHGYNLIGNMQRTCEGDGQWSETAPRCEPVTCPLPPSVQNGQLTQSPADPFTFGIIIVYQCVEGYQMSDDEGTLFCHSDGQWRGILPTCEIVRCATPEGIAHGTVMITGYSYSDTVLYGCKEGYDLLGMVLQTCQADGTWSGEKPKCQPIECVQPPAVQQAAIVGELYYSRKIQYSCAPGYDIVGDGVLKCGADKQWSGQVPRCEHVSCGVPPVVLHGSLIGVEYTYNSTVSYQCSKGYFLVGNSELKCMVSAEWSGEIPECRPVTCGLPPRIQYGFVEGAVFTYSNTIHYECFHGYTVSKDTNLTCTDMGDWVGVPPECVPISCGQPLTIPSSYVIGTDYRFNRSVTYHCLQGYYMVGNPRLVCSETKTWSGELPECRIVSCDVPPKVLNADVSGLQYIYNSTVLYRCRLGYRLTGNAKLACSEHRLWKGEIPECKSINCSAPPPIQHSAVVGDNYSYNKSVSYQCIDGYFHVGNTVLTCSENAEWIGDYFVCKPVLCSPPPSVLNSYTAGIDFTFNKTITYHCKRGHYILGNPTLKCMQDAVWIGNVPECKPITCKLPSNIPFGGFIAENLMYNSNVTYTCKQGYMLVGNAVSYCSENGTWSATSPRCEPVYCGPPPNIPNGNFTDLDFTYNNNVSYWCVYGFELKVRTDKFIECTADGTWAGELPECLPVSCKSPYTVQHGYAIGDVFTYRSTIQFRCNLGYELYGSVLSICSGDGHWTFESTLPHCMPIKCGPPPTVQHATWNETDAAFNTIVTYTCIDGFWMNGSAHVVCQHDRTWQGRAPACLPVSCDAPSTPENGYLTGSLYMFGNAVMYHCASGYNLSGESSRICQTNGRWSSDQPKCLPIDCGLPPDIDNALYIHLTGMTRLGSTVEYRCKDGYESEIKTALHCDVDGVWTGDLFPCVPVSCGRPPSLENGHVIGKSFLFNTKVQYMCSEGFTLTGSPQIGCNANRFWDITDAKCKPVTCPDVIIPNNGFINGTEFYFTKSVKFDCDEGYNLEGVDMITCNANGVWSGSEPVCVPISCAEPAEIDNGSRTFSDTWFKATAWFDCHIGFRLEGVAVLHCLTNGSWSGEVPTCERVPCGVPEIIQNGSVAQMNLFYGDSVKYTCDEGFNLIGRAERFCQADGTLNRAKPQCVIVSCGTPPQVQYGTIQFDSNTYKSVAVSTCDNGYNLIGHSIVQCLSNGTWSLPSPRCQPVSCGNPDDIENGWYELKDGSVAYRAIANYHCRDGFVLSGSKNRNCLATAIWSSAVTLCQPVSCGTPYDIENGWYELENDSVTYGATVRYHCKNGFDLVGSEIRFCLAVAKWSFDITLCQPVSCGLPDDIENGLYELENGHASGYDILAVTTYQSLATYRCNNGYDFFGEAVISCLANRTWSQAVQMCRPVSCREPLTIAHGSYRGSEWIFNSVVHFVCHKGHTMKGSGVIVCQADATWSSNLPVCEPVHCQSPGELVNGNVYSNRSQLQYQSIIQFVCNPGYELIGDAVQSCQEHSSWSAVLPECVPVSCGDPSPVLHGYLQDHINVTFGSVVHYACQIGYEIVSNDHVTCQANGKWSQPLAECESIMCSYPKSPSDGYVHVEEIMYNSKAVYTCLEGFNLVGNKIQRCLSDRTWSGRVPKCQPIICGAPPWLDYSSWSRLDNDVSKDWKFSTTILYTCHKGYTLSANNIAICMANGTWNITTSLICQSVSCSVPSSIPNGQLNATDVTYKSIITYHCNNGYETIGSASAICNADGLWSNDPPRCELVTCPILHAPLHGSVFGTLKYNDFLTFECQAMYELIGIKRVQCIENGTWDHPAPTCRHMSCGRPPDLPNGAVFSPRNLRGDVARHRCYSGYVPEGPRSRVCQANNTWSGDPPKCLGLDSFAAVSQHPVCILPCLHGGTCVGSYQCSCPYGYTGYRCEEVLCTNRCIGGARCTGRHTQCPCQPDSTAALCLRQRQ